MSLDDDDDNDALAFDFLLYLTFHEPFNSLNLFIYLYQQQKKRKENVFNYIMVLYFFKNDLSGLVSSSWCFSRLVALLAQLVKITRVRLGFHRVHRIENIIEPSDRVACHLVLENILSNRFLQIQFAAFSLAASVLIEHVHFKVVLLEYLEQLEPFKEIEGKVEPEFSNTYQWCMKEKAGRLTSILICPV